MAGFNRSQFRGTFVASLAKQDEIQASLRPTGGKQLSGYINLKQGDNKVRIYPFHPDGGGDTFSEQKCVSFLWCSGEERDEKGRAIEGTSVLKRRPVLNSRIHGSSKYDLVDEYLDLAKNEGIAPLLPGESKMAFKLVWDFMTSGNDAIRATNSWLLYASIHERNQWSAPGFLEIKVMIKNELQKIIKDFVGDDESAPEPFTDPDNGISVIIHKTGESLNTKYTCRLDSVRDGVNIRLIKEPLTNKQLSDFSKLDSLHKLCRNTFKISDLEKQIEGLSNFENIMANKTFKLSEDASFRAPLNLLTHPHLQMVMEHLVQEFEGKSENVTGVNIPFGAVNDPDTQKLLDNLDMTPEGELIEKTPVAAPPVVQSVQALRFPPQSALLQSVPKAQPSIMPQPVKKQQFPVSSPKLFATAETSAIDSALTRDNPVPPAAPGTSISDIRKRMAKAN